MFSYSEFLHNYTKSHYKYVEPLSEDFRVFVNGTEIPVYTCRISEFPFNRVWPGYQRSISQTVPASFVNIVSDEALSIKVIPSAEFGEAFIKPYSKGIKPVLENGEITFEMKENGQLVLGLGDFRHTLYIFNSKLIEYEGDATYYFGPGIHMPGKIELYDNQSIYVHKDALVFGCVYAENAKNIRIYGNGIFDDRGEGRISIHCYENYTNGNFKLYDCENVRVEGVLFKDSAIWCVNIFHCRNVYLDDIKVFGQWRYNTDGVDIINSSNITLKNSFIHSFDDTISIKGIDRYRFDNNENITVEGCILWCDWGNCCEIGIETACREYKNIVFRDCDIVHGSTSLLDINNGEYAEISYIVFENIRCEYNSFNHPPVTQKSEDMTYSWADLMHIPALFRIRNFRWRTEEMCNEWSITLVADNIDLSGIIPASVHDVTVKNITVYFDEKLPKENGKCIIPASVKSSVEGVEFFNISISGLCVNGENVDTDYLKFD